MLLVGIGLQMVHDCNAKCPIGITVTARKGFDTSLANFRPCQALLTVVGFW